MWEQDWPEGKADRGGHFRSRIPESFWLATPAPPAASSLSHPYLEVFVQDFRVVAAFRKPPVRNDLRFKPLNEVTPQLVPVSLVADNCRVRTERRKSGRERWRDASSRKRRAEGQVALLKEAVRLRAPWCHFPNAE